MGAAWILRDIRQCHLGGLDWYGSRSYLLFLGRCVSEATRRFSYTQDAVIFVSTWSPIRWHPMNIEIMIYSYTLPRCRQKLFNEIHDDINYSPLPEDRPGGFNWGEEVAQNNGAADDE